MSGRSAGHGGARVDPTPNPGVVEGPSVASIVTSFTPPDPLRRLVFLGARREGHRVRPTTDLLPWVLLSIAALLMSGAAADALRETTAVDLQAFESKACEGPAEACTTTKAAPHRYVLAADAFALDSAELPSELMPRLDAVAAALREQPVHAVRVEVHTDASGPPEARRTLTQRRADAVRAYLVERGVDAAVLYAVGMGSSVPRPGQDPYAAANRRIEVVRL